MRPSSLLTGLPDTTLKLYFWLEYLSNESLAVLQQPDCPKEALPKEAQAIKMLPLEIRQRLMRATYSDKNALPPRQKKLLEAVTRRSSPGNWSANAAAKLALLAHDSAPDLLNRVGDRQDDVPLFYIADNVMLHLLSIDKLVEYYPAINHFVELLGSHLADDYHAHKARVINPLKDFHRALATATIKLRPNYKHLDVSKLTIYDVPF